MIIVFCEPSNPMRLYNMFKDDMASDILYNVHKANPSVDYNYAIYNESLDQIGQTISSMSNGQTLQDFSLPLSIANTDGFPSSEYFEVLSYNPNELDQFITCTLPKLNTEQSIVNQVMECVNEGIGKLFYLDAAGGTGKMIFTTLNAYIPTHFILIRNFSFAGKTFVIKVILALTRVQKKIALAVASSGIAATLIP